MRPDDADDAELTRSFSPMPPVVSRPVTPRSVGIADGQMLAPIGGGPASVPAMPKPVTEDEALAPEVAELPAHEEPSALEDVPLVFDADDWETEASLDALSSPTDASSAEGSFPLDAFISPEQPPEQPTAIESSAPAPASETTLSPAHELADRLERLSQRMRADDASAVLAQLARGDKLDAMLAGLLAGYLGNPK